MAGLGFLLLIVSWINLAIVLNEPMIKAALESAGIQFCLLIVGVVIGGIASIIPFFGNIALIAVAMIGSYYFPTMTVTFMCTAFGIAFLIGGTPERKK